MRTPWRWGSSAFLHFGMKQDRGPAILLQENLLTQHFDGTGAVVAHPNFGVALFHVRNLPRLKIIPGRNRVGWRGISVWWFDPGKSLTSIGSTNVEQFRKSLTGRLSALAKAQSALLGNKQRASLRELSLAELSPYQTPDEANVAVNVSPVQVGPRAVQVLALAIHELATNSAKHGALSNPEGRIAVTSTFVGEGDRSQVVIEWREAGGPPVQTPKREGFGTRLIKDVVAKSLKADVVMDYRPEGLHFRLTVPTEALEKDW